MNLEEKEVINLILQSNNLGLCEIANSLSMDLGKLKNIIHTINNKLLYESIKETDGKLLVTEKCADELYSLLIGDDHFISFNHNVELRKYLVEIELMVNKNFHSLQTLSEKLYVSRNTMYTDIKLIKEDLQHLNLKITYSRKSGYQIKGQEYALRNQLVQLIRKLLKNYYGRAWLKRLNLFTEKEILESKNRLLLIEEKIQIRLTDEQLDELPFILALLIARIRNFPIQWDFNIEKYDIRNTMEFSAIKDCFHDLTFLKETDILYLSLHILASNQIESAIDYLNREEINLAVNQFLKIIKSKLAVKFIKESELKEKLLLHLQPAIFRNVLGFRVINPLKERFMTEHHKVFMAVADATEPFEKIIGHPLSDEEIVYLSMIILGWLYQSEESENSYFKGVVLCQNGTSISKLLLENLKEMFPQIEFIGAFSFRQFKQMNEEVDIVFTTKPLKSKAKTIIVPSFLEPENRIQLRYLVNKLLNDDIDFRAKQIVSALKDILPKDKIYIAENKLKTLFEGDKKISLKNDLVRMTIDEKNIILIDNQIPWEDSVDITFSPIIKRGSVDQSYVQRCKQLFFENYNKMLIGPNVYIPHAEPSNKLKQPDIQIAVFFEPIYNPDGSPFHVMVGLVPSNTNIHVPFLLRLNDFFIKKDSIKKLLASKNPREVLALLGSDAIKESVNSN